MVDEDDLDRDVWLDANLQELDAAIKRVRERLEWGVLARLNASSDLPRPAETTVSPSPHFALGKISARFGLTNFERELLVLAVAAELSGDIGRLCGQMLGSPEHGVVTFGLALSILSEPYWQALRPDAPLRAYDLVLLEGGENPPGLAQRRLRAAEPVVHFLLGNAAMDAGLAPIVDPVSATGIWPSHMDALRQAALICSQPRSPAVHLAGDIAAAVQVAAAASNSVRKRLFRIAPEFLPTEASAIEQFCRRWNRDAALLDVALLIDCDGAPPTARASLTSLVGRLSGPVFLVGNVPAEASAPGRQLMRIEVGAPTVEEKTASWAAALADLDGDMGPAAARLAEQFRLDPGVMHAIADTVGSEPGTATEERIWSLARAQGRQQLVGLAQRVEGGAGFDALVLPEATLAILHQIVSRQRRRGQVFGAWDMGRSPRSRGLSALFTGPSGTGKTLAAEVVANTLELDLYRIDVASIVDKYIGETEKNLRQVFDAAERTGAVLLFDEADALFSKRSDVKDSRDRSANLEVGYLLQRMESYCGVAILTSNLPDSIDPAFQRRFTFTATFHFPAIAERRLLWRRAFPSAVSPHDLDIERLAGLPLSGAQIASVALNAAFTAADAGEAIGMAHVERAVSLEFGKRNLPSPLAMADAASAA